MPNPTEPQETESQTQPRLCPQATVTGGCGERPAAPSVEHCEDHLTGEEEAHLAFLREAKLAPPPKTNPRKAGKGNYSWTEVQEPIINALRLENIINIEGHYYQTTPGVPCVEVATSTVHELINEQITLLKGSAYDIRRFREIAATAEQKLHPYGVGQLIKDDPLALIELPEGLYKGTAKRANGVLFKNALVEFTDANADTPAELTATLLTTVNIWSRREPVNAVYSTEPADTPLWDKACESWGMNQEMQAYLEAQIGWTLLERGPHDHGIVKLLGPGGTGKSTLIKVIAHLAGASTQTALANLGTRFGSQIIETCRALLLSETDKTTNKDASTRHSLSTLKAIAGGDKIPIEPKGKPAYDATPRCSTWLASNHNQGWADGADDLAAWKRRDRMIEMRTLTSEPVRNLAEKIIEAEADAIANRSILAYVEWINNNQPTPKQVTDFTAKQLTAGMPPRQRFISECLVVDPDGELLDTDFAAAAVIYDSTYSDKQELTKLRGAVTRTNGATKKQNTETKGWLGIRLAEGTRTTHTENEQVDADLADYAEDTPPPTHEPEPFDYATTDEPF